MCSQVSALIISDIHMCVNENGCFEKATLHLDESVTGDGTTFPMRHNFGKLCPLDNKQITTSLQNQSNYTFSVYFILKALNEF